MITIADIQRRVAACCAVLPEELTGHNKKRRIVRPRQIAMYLSRQLTALSLPQIGRGFGNRHHTTVMHACQVVDWAMRRDGGFRDQVTGLRLSLEAPVDEL